MKKTKKPRELSPRHSPEARWVFNLIANAKFSGTRKFVLASDECGDWYTGPAWAPFNLWQAAEYGRDRRGECARILCYSAGSESLWAAIAARYSDPDTVALSLPMVCADAKDRWGVIPRLTPRGYREQREKLARHAEQLAIELERFYLHRDPDMCELPGLLDFAELMTPEELDRFDGAIRGTSYSIVARALRRAELPPVSWAEYNDIGDQARALGYRDSDLFTPAREDARGIYSLMYRDHVSHWQYEYEYGGVPTLPDMLRRIARRFAEDGKDPPIARPNLPNAERNFFARALCKYFWQSKRDISPAIVRDVVCMFYSQGIGENEVSHLAAREKKAEFPLSSDPENSPPF